MYILTYLYSSQLTNFETVIINNNNNDRTKTENK